MPTTPIDIVLVNSAPLQAATRLRATRQRYPYPCIGLMSVAGQLIMHGLRVTIIDLFRTEFASREEFQRHLAEVSSLPRIVGISTFTETAGDAARIALAVREVFPFTTIVMGGPHPTFCANEILASCPQVDFVVRGEGEATLIELLEALRHPASYPLASIRGLSYRDPRRMVTTTPDRPFLTHLDTLPLPPEHLLADTPSAGGQRTLTILSSRGCPGSCIFCASRSMSGGRYRMHSAERLASQVHHSQLTRPFTAMNVLDDTFLADTDRLRSFCGYLDKLTLRVAWSCKSRVDTITDDVLKLLRDHHCLSIHIGAESADDTVLRSIAKHITLERTLDAIVAMKRHGIRPEVSFIIGHHSDTAETMNKTVLFARTIHEHNIGVAIIGICTPYPGTPLHRRAEQLGVRFISRDWSHYDCNTPVFITQHFTAADLRTAEYRFHFAPLAAFRAKGGPAAESFFAAMDDFAARVEGAVKEACSCN